jgi:hypothetical protein
MGWQTDIEVYRDESKYLVLLSHLVVSLGVD